MATHYFGICERTPTAGKPGRIEVLGRLLGSDERGWQVDLSFDVAEFGPTGRVTWPNSSPFPQKDLDFHVVCFEVEKSKADTKKTGPTVDRYRVARRRGSFDWSVDRFGAWIVERENARWDQEPRRIEGALEGARVFVHDGPDLLGPWEVRREEGDLRLFPEQTEPSFVLRFAVDTLEPETLFTLDEAEFLVNDPDPALGEPVDLSSREELAAWFLDRLGRVSSDAVELLDECLPGWREHLEEDIYELSDSSQALLYLQRLERVDSVVSLIARQNEAFRNLLNSNPTMQALLKRNIVHEVEARAEEIARDAAERAGTLPSPVPEQATSGPQRSANESRLKEEAARLEALRSELATVATHLEENRRRLLLDFQSFQALLKEAVPGTDGRLKIRPSPKLQGPWCQDPRTFVDRRLRPCVHLWLPQTAPIWPKVFHYAILACPWVLVPSAAWARAYQEAMGGTCELAVVTVEPTWISFQDAWRGEVSLFWRRAPAEPDRLFLICLESLNPALPECWASPFLNLRSGLRETLPVDEGFGWPSNLRLIATTAADPASFPVSHVIARHCGALPLQPTAEPTATKLHPGHVEVPQWLSWAGVASQPTTLAEETIPLGYCARTASADLARLVEVMRDHGEEPARASRLATRIRLEWPAEYCRDGSA